ncbi:MAG TPA: RNA polymerase sigma factor [Thermoanaerobaculia bacterium]|jgi:RNA polymerase sigma-70 factor (ECF subfamily)|nr:RNA polymerase sigma factor [Thermoanaerobaculia bacterium]
MKSQPMAVSSDRPVEEDFQDTFREYYPRLRSYFLAQGFSTFDAEDLSQTALWNVYRSQGQFRAEGSYAAWVYTVAKNAARDEWRRRGRALETDSLDRPLGEEGGETLAATVADERPSAEHDAHGREDLARTVTALAALPARMRACLLLHVQQGLSYGEVARRLTLSVPTVKVQIWNARRRLRQLLEGTA